MNDRVTSMVRRSRLLRRAATETLESRRLLAADLGEPESVLALYGTAAADVITLDVAGGQFQFTLNGATTAHSMSGVTTVEIYGLAGNDWINVERNGGAQAYVYGGDGADAIHLAWGSENLSNVAGYSYAYGGADLDSVTAWDRNVPADQTYTLDYLALNRAGFGGMLYGSDVESLLLLPTLRSATTNIPSTDAATRVRVQNAGSTDVVNIGNTTTGVQSIAGQVWLENPDGGTVDVNITDAGDAVARTAAIDYDPDGYTSLNGLAPVPIVWGAAGFDDVRITTGNAADTVNVLGTLHRLYLNSAEGYDRVNVGNGSSGVRKIGNLLQVDNNPRLTTLLIDNGADPVARTASLDLTTVGFSTYNVLTGLAPAAIQYDSFDMDQVTIRAGLGADTINVRYSTEDLTISNAGSIDTVNVGNPANGAQGITGPLHVTSPSGWTTLNITDAADTTARTNVRLDVSGPRGVLTGLAPAQIDWVTDDISGQGVTITTGSQADAVTVARLQTGIRLTEASGAWDQVSVGDPALGTAGVQATIILDNPSGYTYLTVDDTGGATPRSVTFDHTTMSGAEWGQVSGFGGVGGQIFYKLNDTRSPIIYRGGGGDDTYTVLRALTVGLQVDGGSGNDDFYVSNVATNDVSQVHALVTLSGGTGLDECWVMDANSVNAGGFTVNGALIQRAGMSDLSCVGMDNLYLYGGGGTVAKTHRVVDTSPGYAVYLYDGPSPDHVYVDRTSGAPVYVLQTSTSDWLSVGYNTALAGANVILPSSATYLGHFELAKNALVTVGLPGEGLSDGQKVLYTESYLFNNPSRLDLGAHSMIVEYQGDSPIDSVRSGISLGYDNGAWDGWALWSRFANAGQYGLGYALSSDLYGPGGGTFHGVPVDGTAVLVSFTRYGDTNLDRAVNIADFSRLGAQFNAAGTYWFGGDFNYDGSTNIADFSLLAGNFNTGVPAARSGLFGARLIDDVL